MSDSGKNSIQKFRPDGTFLLKWGDSGSGPGQFSAPRGMSFGPDGYLYVCDSNNNRVQAFNPVDGSYLFSVNYGINVPYDVTFDSAGDLYVTDYYGSIEVTKYTWSEILPDCPGDFDCDGILDSLEDTYDTDPYNADTDADGISDGDELTFWGDNWNLDYDSDGLHNLIDRDSDGDGYMDGEEINFGSDPSDPGSVPSETDTDGDGIADVDEIAIYETDPTMFDTDGDGIGDGGELNYWGDNWDVDYDDDGLNNLIDEDSDGDGYLDGEEINFGSNPSDPGSVPSIDNILVNGSFEDDSDGDNNPDHWIIAEPVEVDDSEKVDGIYSAKIESTEVINNINRQYVDLAPDTTYILSGWIKTENVTGGGGAQVYPYDYGGVIDATNWIRVEGTTDWTYYSMQFTTGADPSRARINFRLFNATGTAWFDNIKLYNDTDGDSIADVDEIEIYGTDPTMFDTDGDGIGDGDELAFWGDNWNVDYDSDGLNNLIDVDSDGDGYSDGEEINFGSDPSDPGSVPSISPILVNGSFEYDSDGDDNPDDWIIYEPVELDFTESVDGQYSAKIESTAVINNINRQYVDLEPDTTYTLSGWIKTENVTGGGGAQVYPYDYGGVIDPSKWIRVEGTTDWTYYSMQFTTGADPSNARINFRLYVATGTAWFDNINLVVTSIDNILVNGGFEYDSDGDNNPDHWIIAEPVEVDDSEKVDGIYSAKIESTEVINNINRQYVDLEPDTTYTLSGWIKTENVTGGGGAQVYPYDYGGVIDPSKWIRVEGTTDWTYYSMQFTTGADPSNARINFRLYGATGTAWFDSINLVEGGS